MRRRVAKSMGAPFHITSPASGVSTPRTMRIVVVLPAPLLPTNPNTSPGLTSRLSPDTASRSPYCLVIPRSSRPPVSTSPVTLADVVAEPAPAVRSAVRSALRILPHAPGVYLFRDAGGQVVYVGRSRNLAARVRSYWSDLRDRPHLRRMVARVAWVEPVICESEHEAAFLESDLLERHPTRYNRTLGMESRVWLRLSADPRSPGLDVVHDPTPADGASWFGPYLGWEPARQAAAGLLRLYPLRFTASAPSRSDRELARSLGVSEHDRLRLARAIRDVL